MREEADSLLAHQDNIHMTFRERPYLYPIPVNMKFTTPIYPLWQADPLHNTIPPAGN